MKRLNPSTGKPFVRGDLRADGFLFYRYSPKKGKNDFFYEIWLRPESLAKIKISDIKYRERTKERKQETDRNWLEKNKERKSQTNAAWRERNKEKHIAQIREWCKKNKDKKRAHAAKRRANKLSATPPWLTKEHYIQIESVYAQAKQLTEQTGIPHEVDHVVPLINKLVCGLHVPWNLEVKTLEANRKKSNSFHL